jgi:hypothetical protein
MNNIKIRIPKKLYESIKEKAALNESEVHYFWKKDRYGSEKCYAKDDEGNVWQVDSSKCKRRGTYNNSRDHLNEDIPSTQELMGIIAGISSLGLGGLAIAKIQDYIKKKNPELYKKLEDTHATMDKAYRGGVDEAINEVLRDRRTGFFLVEGRLLTEEEVKDEMTVALDDLNDEAQSNPQLKSLVTPSPKTFLEKVKTNKSLLKIAAVAAIVSLLQSCSVSGPCIANRHYTDYYTNPQRYRPEPGMSRRW